MAKGTESAPRPQTRPAGGGSSCAVEVAGLTKSFRRANGNVVVPVDDVTLQIFDGEFLVLVGPSGCGKTTLLRCIAGLESPSAGSIKLRDATVFDAAKRLNVAPEHRGIGMIFQSYALWPHLTVFKNVAYPLEAAKVPRREIRERVMTSLELVGVSDIAEQVPDRLSGGQQQRVAVARALVAEPRLILFDEPLSNVDAKVREELRLELLAMQRRLGFTAIYVTHDQAEAMELADRIAVLGDGRIRQLDTPRAVYTRPASSYVAQFIGAANTLTGSVTVAGAGAATVSCPESRTTLEVRSLPEPMAAGDRVDLIWRPEQTRIEPAASAAGKTHSDRLCIEARVLFKRFLGATSELVCQTPSRTEFRVLSAGEFAYEPGQEVTLSVAEADVSAYPAGGPAS